MIEEAKKVCSEQQIQQQWPRLHIYVYAAEIW